MVSSTTTDWLTQRPKWLQVTAKRLLESGDLNDAVTSLQDRKTKVLPLDSEDALGTASQSHEWIEKIRNISKGYEESAKKYEEDAGKDNRVELQAKLKDWHTEFNKRPLTPAIQEVQ